jgi:hypothetical protein
MIVMREIQLRLAAGGLVRTGFSSLGRIRDLTGATAIVSARSKCERISTKSKNYGGKQWPEIKCASLY